MVSTTYCYTSMKDEMVGISDVLIHKEVRYVCGVCNRLHGRDKLSWFKVDQRWFGPRPKWDRTPGPSEVGPNPAPALFYIFSFSFDFFNLSIYLFFIYFSLFYFFFFFFNFFFFFSFFFFFLIFFSFFFNSFFGSCILEWLHRKVGSYFVDARVPIC